MHIPYLCNTGTPSPSPSQGWSPQRRRVVLLFTYHSTILIECIRNCERILTSRISPAKALKSCLSRSTSPWFPFLHGLLHLKSSLLLLLFSSPLSLYYLSIPLSPPQLSLLSNPSVPLTTCFAACLPLNWNPNCKT